MVGILIPSGARIFRHGTADRNRPSVVIWGLGNEVENQGQPSMIRLLRMLREYLLTLDDTRPVSVALNPHFKRESGVDARVGLPISSSL